jgi:fatty-acid desaturase
LAERCSKGPSSSGLGTIALTTDLNPYNAGRALFWIHISWLLLMRHTKPGFVDISDLRKNKIVIFQGY